MDVMLKKNMGLIMLIAGAIAALMGVYVIVSSEFTLTYGAVFLTGCIIAGLGYDLWIKPIIYFCLNCGAELGPFLPKKCIRCGKILIEDGTEVEPTDNEPFSPL